jgi:hypothetical protein
MTSHLVRTVLIASLALGGCATFRNSSTPRAVQDAADSAYITVATFDPAHAVTAWMALQAERMAYVTLTGDHVADALDLQADGLRPSGSPPPIMLMARERPMTRAEAKRIQRGELTLLNRMAAGLPHHN